MTNLIDEKRLEEMRNGQDMPPLYEIIETLSLALKVVRAAQALMKEHDTPAVLHFKPFREALAPFSQGSPQKCPGCKGTGKVFSADSSGASMDICGECFGEKEKS